MDKETRDALENAAKERKSIYEHRDEFEKEVLQRLTAIETRLGLTMPIVHTIINLIAVGVAIWAVLDKNS